MITFTTVASSPEVGSIVIPSFTTPISAAYLDFVVQRANNDDAGVNYLVTGGSFGIMDSTNTTYTKASDIVGGTLYTLGVGQWDSHYVIPGSIDIKAAIQPGHTQKVKFKDIVTANNSINCWGLYGELRLYFGVG